MFIVLSTQRSGSSFLMTCLDSHPDVTCAKELFNPTDGKKGTYRHYARDSLRSFWRHWTDRQRFIDEYLSALEADCPRLFGFKLMYAQVRLYPELLPWLEKSKVVHLRRRHHLATLVSRKVARARGVYDSLQGDFKPVKVSLDVRSLHGQLSTLEAEAREFGKFDSLSVDYEDFDANRETEGARILDYLGVSPMPMQSPLKRASTGTLADRIENYSDVVRALSGTRYAKLLI